MNKEILEGNKLIEEFMAEDPGVLRQDLKQAGTLESMQYHKSWDLLMPVVGKIEDLFDGDITVEIEGCNVLIHYVDEYRNYTTMSSKIEAVWYAVVGFIKWYNSIK